MNRIAATSRDRRCCQLMPFAMIATSGSVGARDAADLRRRQRRVIPAGAIHRRCRWSRFRSDALHHQLRLIIRPRHQRGNVHISGRNNTRLSPLLRGCVAVPRRLPEATHGLPDQIPLEGLDVALGHCHAKDRVGLFPRATLIPIQKIVNHGRELITSRRRYDGPQRARRAGKSVTNPAGTIMINVVCST